MAKNLKPDKLEEDPSSPKAKEEYRYWKRNVESFFRAADANINKLDALINFVSPRVYTWISEETTYDAAIAKLESLYIKKKNLIFSRYQLLTEKQESGQDIDKFVEKTY